MQFKRVEFSNAGRETIIITRTSDELIIETTLSKNEAGDVLDTLEEAHELLSVVIENKSTGKDSNRLRDYL